MPGRRRSSGFETSTITSADIEADYRFSRIKADTPLNAQGATFGIGYRF